MLANRSHCLGAAIPLVGAVSETRQPGTAHPLLWLTLATCLYSLVTVPLFNPRDSRHAVPRALAAVLIIVGLVVAYLRRWERPWRSPPHWRHKGLSPLAQPAR
jgi:hypothetical protein